MDINGYLTALTPHYVAWGVVMTLVTVLEMLSPRGHRQRGSRLKGLGYWFLAILFAFVLTQIFAAIWKKLGVDPLMTWPALEPLAGSPILTAVVASIGIAVTHDFFFYWFHRAQHRFFWRWHAVHHSVRDLNAVNSYHHISEGLFTLVLLQIPATFLLGGSAPSLPLLNALLWCHVVWIHSPTRFTLGPLRAVLVDNRFHRIHHSLETRHFDKNFGAFTPLWDRLFGTCHMPEKNEWPDVGLADVPEPKGLRDWWEIPARIKRDAAADADAATGVAALS